MTTHSVHRRACSSLFVLAAALSVAATSVPGIAAGSTTPQSGRHVTVMTRNLYLGADFTPLLSVPPSQLTAAVVGILGAVQASAPSVRMQQVAAEIHAASPDVVALQEAADWTSAVPGVPSLNYSYDFSQLILDDLSGLGDDYAVAVDQANFDSYNDLAIGHLMPGRFVDHDVILVKEGTLVQRTGVAHFAQQLTYASTPIGPVTFTRGYVWADVKIPQGKVYRIVDAHFEAYSDAIAAAQASELLAAMTETHNPTILTGDLNSDANLASGAAVQAFLDAGYSDAWSVLHPTLPGFTCCEPGTLAGAPADGSALDQRIDHVLALGQATPLQASLVDVAAFEATPPMWPSDHVGLVVSYGIGHYA